MSSNSIRFVFARWTGAIAFLWLLATPDAAAQNFWQRTNIPVVEVLSLAVNSSGHIFAGTTFSFNGGVFRSTDNGRTWALVLKVTENVTALAINLRGHIFAGTLDGIFRSTDNGENWKPINDGFRFSPHVQSLLINARDYIFAGIDNEIFRSTDNGETWNSTNLEVGDVLSLAVNPVTQDLFAGTGPLSEDDVVVFRSTDDGENWMPTGLKDFDVRALVINPTTQDIFAGRFDGVIRSMDNGISWTRLNLGSQDASVVSLVIPPGQERGGILAGTAGDGDGVFHSIDNGENWMPVNTGFNDEALLSIHSFAVNPVTRDIFAGTREGVFRGTPPIVQHTPPSLQEANREFSITANVVAETGAAAAALHYRRGGDKNFIAKPMARTGVSYQAAIPPDSVTSRGVEYFFITDLGGFKDRTPASGVFSIPIEVPAPGLVRGSAQPAGSEQTAYRLLSAPLDLDDKDPRMVLADDLGAYNIKKWRLYELLSNQQYIEFPNAAAMTPGKAFWLIVKNPGRTIDTGKGKSNQTSQAYAIPLHPQWNFVGNPFHFTVPIDNVSFKKSGKPAELRSYTGKWNDRVNERVTEMQPFEGYAVFNDSNAPDLLVINPHLTDTTGSRIALRASSSEKSRWSIRLLAQCQEARDTDNLAAIVASASNGWDEMDHPEPPTVGEYVSVYFPHSEWNKLSRNYCADFRPESSEGSVWLFAVKTNISDKVNLSFAGLESVPNEFEIWLADEAVNLTQNLREMNHCTVAGSELPKQLKLVVGKRDFIDEKLTNLQQIPTTYELSQNFPNPFNPATTIRYGLPQAERVTLKIYNLLGEEVALIMNDELQAAGYHVAIWDGRNKLGEVVGSGVYVYRFRAGSFTAMKKMALVK